MTPTMFTLLAALRPLATPLDWDAPTPCRHCGRVALDHEVLGNQLVCPLTAGGQGETGMPREEEEGT